MASRILISVVVFSSVLMGCSTMKSSGPPTFDATSWVNCQTGGGTPGAPKRCDVEVSVNGSCPGADVTFDKTDLALKGNGHTVIVWKLPAGYLFCPAQGDGAYLKFIDDTDQFSDPAGTDDDTGALVTGTSKCKKFFRLRDDNTKSTEGTAYRYRVQFTDKRNKTTCTTDPYIRNG